MSFSHHLATNVCRPLSVNFSHFHLLLKYHWAKLGCYTLWMLHFQNCVWWPCSTSKMAAMAQNRRMDWNQIWSNIIVMYGSLPKLCPLTLSIIHSWLCNFLFSSIILSFWHYHFDITFRLMIYWSKPRTKATLTKSPPIMK